MQQERLEFPDDGGVWRIDLRINAGDSVSPGDTIAVIESDSAGAEIDAPQVMRIVRIKPITRGYLLFFENPNDALSP